MATIESPSHRINRLDSYSDKLEECRPILHGFIRSRINNSLDVEDILQETMLILISKKDEYDPDKNFLNWATSIARFQILKQLTLYKRNKIICDQEHINNIYEETYSEKKHTLRRKALYSCIKKMPKHMKSIAFLRFRRDKSIKEISDIVHRPLGAVSATMHRIRENIYKSINDEYFTLESEYDFSNNK